MIHFDVEFFLERHNVDGHRTTIDHKIKFQEQLKSKKMKTVCSIDDLLSEGFNVDEYDFIIYSLFRHQNDYRKGFKNHKQISDIAYNRINDFLSFYDFSASIKNSLTQKQAGADRTYSEYQGVAGSLLLSNKLFGLTNADYKGIKEIGNKVLDFDYELASNGIRFIKIESKGGFGIDDSIWTDANSIIAKKVVNKYLDNTRDLYYGVVTQVPFNNEEGNAKCTIVDPPSDEIPINPYKYKLHTRLSYYANKFSFLQHGSIYLSLDSLLNILEKNDSSDWENEFIDLVSFYKEFNTEIISAISFRNSLIDLGETELKAWVRVDWLDGNEFLVYGLLKDTVLNIIAPYPDEIININYNIETKNSFMLKGEKLKFYNKKSRTIEMIKLYGKVKLFETGEVFGILYTERIYKE